MLFGGGDVPCQWSTTSEFGAAKIHMSYVSWGERHPQSECLGRLNARQVDCTVFVSEKTVTGRSYLDMLELYALLQLPPQIILQQDGTLPHLCHHDRNHLDKRWLGDTCSSAEMDQSLGLLSLHI
jgi:hypothetical protein